MTTNCQLNLSVFNADDKTSIQLVPDLFPPVDAVNADGYRYSFTVTQGGGTGASIVIKRSGYKDINHRLEFAPNTTPEPGIPWPSIPTYGSWELISETLTAVRPEPKSRDERGNIQIHFQGRRVMSKAYSDEYNAQYGYDGAIPYFGAALPDFAMVGDLDQVLDQLSDDSHVMAFVSLAGPGYNEPGQPYGIDQIVKPSDCWNGDNFDNLYIPMVDNIINRGQIPMFTISGEGSPDWVKENFTTFVSKLRDGYDRLAYGVISVAFDGVWPASWSVQDMLTMIPWMRSVLDATGDGSNYLLFFWFSDGPAGSPYLYVVTESDYSQLWMDGLDGVLTTTGPDQVECPSLPNYAQYMCKDLTPSGKCEPDWHGPFILVDCSRGKRFWGVIEWNTYDWVRNQVTEDVINQQRDRIKALNIQVFG